MADLSPPEIRTEKGDKPFWINGLPKQIRSKIRVQKRSGCWLWQGTIRPARQRQRLPRYACRIHDVFGDPFRIEREAALPEVWDGRTGTKVPAHRFIRSVLTCVPIEDVPRLSRCADPRCVSPFHSMEVGPPPGRKQRSAGRPTVETVAGKNEAKIDPEIVVDVLGALKEHGPSTSFLAPDDFAAVEQDCDLPAGSLTMPVWDEYIAWDVEENPDVD